MTTEIEELCALLRSPSYWKSSDGYSEAFDNAPYRAADHIERLASENEALRGAMREAGRLLMGVENAVPTAKEANNIILAALSKKGEGA